MEPFISTAFDMVQLDDLMAGSRGYGDTNEYPNQNDTPGTATDIGALNDGDFYLQNSLTVDDNSDEDWFKMTVPAGSEMSVVLIPYGGTYLSGPQNANGSCSPGSSVNYTEQTDLSFDIVDSDMSTVIASGNTQPIGVIEQLNNISLPSGAGDYYVRVYGPGVNLSQLYQVRIDIDVVVSNNPPVAVCQDVSSCDGNVVAGDVDNGSSDPDLDPLNFTLEPAGPYAPGQTVVNLIVDDGALADTCQATITVNQAPIAVCQNFAVMGDSLGCVVAVPADSIDAGSSDPDLDALTLTLEPAGPYAEGVTNVDLIVTDPCGAADTCQATITVTCPDGPMLAVDPGSVLFAGVVLGDTACAKVTVYNTGDLDMTISSINGCGTAPFYLDQTGLSTTVTPGDSTCFTVCVAPTGAGPDSCQVQVLTDGGNETIDVSLASVTSVPGDAISTSVVLSPVFPNPFASRAQIRFTLPVEGRVDLDVFDMNGRRIRSLYSGTKASGDHTMTWDGRNSAGREVAGGIYFLRLNHKSGQQVVRAVKVE
ncbi:MAG: choice-of-anchor D domain-containing protein, partial [Candidatus Eisenbacteria bacterium]|nr:choice-of-anchor D domain-containing protein [Candidatus Eisenbacteria bacterium]